MKILAWVILGTVLVLSHAWAYIDAYFAARYDQGSGPYGMIGLFSHVVIGLDVAFVLIWALSTVCR